MKPLRVLSLGAGVQSSTVALMMKHGEIEKADVMIFADTCAEPAAVYRFLAWLVPECGIPFAQVTHGDGLTAALERYCRGEQTAPLPPLFTVNADGSKGMLRRICTDRFKIRIVRAKSRTLMVKDQCCVTVRGISADELQRAKPSDVKWIYHDHPLIDREMTRQDCKRWMVSHGYPIPPRSACVFCPYKSDAEWQRLKDTDPAGWDRAVEVDAALRTTGSVANRDMRCSMYVHRSCKPLGEVEFHNGTGWLSFVQECQGMCGV